MRSQITVPICLTTTITDEALFEGAANPSEKFYLPRYRVAQKKSVSGQKHYRISLAPDWIRAGVWSIYLQAYPAPEIEHGQS